jgi:hypothetical protein
MGLCMSATLSVYLYVCNHDSLYLCVTMRAYITILVCGDQLQKLLWFFQPLKIIILLEWTTDPGPRSLQVIFCIPIACFRF